MATCTLHHFLEAVKPWLDKNYIRSAGLRENGDFVLHFADNVRDVYHVNDCDRAQLEAILADFRDKGIAVPE